MTETRRWIEGWRSKHAAREGATALLRAAAAASLALAAGVTLARAGVYQAVPVAVIVGWAGVVAAVAWSVHHFRSRVRASDLRHVADWVEQEGHLRRGSVKGVVDDRIFGSPALVEVADRRTWAWLNEHGVAALSPARRRSVRTLQGSAFAGVLGVSLLALAGPTHGRATAFWRPISTLGFGRGAVRLSADRDEVRRGESITLTVSAPGRRSVTLSQRAPGEPWSTLTLPLDSVGHVAQTFGPLESDRYFRAGDGRRTSETIHVRVAFPAFLNDLLLSASFPAYLERPDEPLYPGDSVFLPVGTRLTTQGNATVPVASAVWRIGDDDVAALDLEESRFSGTTVVRRSGEWQLVVTGEDGPLEDAPPVLRIVAVSDSLPEVTVPVPGVDTTVAASLRQLLVVDARDDHGLSRVEITSRRARGQGSDTAGGRVDSIPLPAGGTDRAVLQWVLDLNDRGFHPGDTAYYRVRAFDNAPTPQVASTREYALRLPSERDLREAMREQADQLTRDADSLARAQRELAEATRDLAAAGESRSEDPRARDAADRMDFESAQEADEVRQEQERLMERAEELAQQLQELAETGWEAGMTDPEWHRRLAELQEMLEQAMTPEMQAALEQLQQAVEQLDAEAVQEMLERLAEQQAQLQEQLERSRELFERAALEGELSTLAEDAEELADRQQDWNEAAQDSSQSDSSLAAQEQAMAQEVQDLEQRLKEMQDAMQQQMQSGETTQQAQQRAGEAASQMQQAAQQAQQGQRQQAQQSGQSASENLDPVAQQLREQLEEMRQQWREEVLGMMDAALTETADLAERQEEVAQRLERGEGGAEVRGEQAAIREGVDQVIQRLQEAAGRNALVSPNLSTALGFSRLQMTEALQELQEGTPNTRQAGDRAGQALDGLNEVAYALLRNRGSVEGSQSGSGMAEAMQQMAEMAQEQQAMAGEANSLLPMMASGQQQMLQQLQELADRQRQLGEELERMGAEDGPSATEELAEEAIDVARELEAGRLDRETVERQEQLFRRLLDAGRTLRNDEEEEDSEERQSESAEQDNVRLPPEWDPNAAGAEARFPYPSWEQLRQFSPEQRRLILDYFRRLNAQPRRR